MSSQALIGYLCSFDEICNHGLAYLKLNFSDTASNLLLQGLDGRGFFGINFCTPVQTSMYSCYSITATTMCGIRARLLYITLANNLHAENLNCRHFCCCALTVKLDNPYFLIYRPWTFFLSFFEVKSLCNKPTAIQALKEEIRCCISEIRPQLCQTVITIW